MKEDWRPVVGFEGAYEVSDQGRVRSLDRVVIGKTKNGNSLSRPHAGRILSTQLHRAGYVLVHLYRDGERKCETVHTLVAQAFLGPRPADKEVAHEDGNPAHNSRFNLAYKTTAENHADKKRHGTQPRGEQSVLAVLSEIEVAAIRKSCETHSVIAGKYRVSRGQVSRIKRRENWRHV